MLPRGNRARKLEGTMLSSLWVRFRYSLLRLLQTPISWSAFTCASLSRLKRSFFTALPLLLSHLLLPAIAGAQVEPVKRVLILNEANALYPAIDSIDRGIQAALSESPFKLEFYVESLDT